CALGIKNTVRSEWDEVDLRYREHAIEVKTSAYLQSWPQSAPSKIIFDIAKKNGWSAETNRFRGEKLRSADIYVFCLLTEQDLTKIDPTNLDQWQFYI